MNDIVLIIFTVFVAGIAVGTIISRLTTEKKERDLLKTIEKLEVRNNEIFDDFKQVISFNNKLAAANNDLSDRLEIFVKEWNGE